MWYENQRISESQVWQGPCYFYCWTKITPNSAAYPHKYFLFHTTSMVRNLCDFAEGFWLRSLQEVAVKLLAGGLKSFEGWCRARGLLPRWLIHMAVGRRPQYLATWWFIGLPECFQNTTAGIPQREWSERERDWETEAKMSLMIQPKKGHSITSAILCCHIQTIPDTMLKGTTQDINIWPWVCRKYQFEPGINWTLWNGALNVPCPWRPWETKIFPYSEK